MLTSSLKKLTSNTSFFLLLLIIFSGFRAGAQRINDNSVIKDSSGIVYPAAIWHALLMKGGHVLKPENKNDPNTAFFIVSLSDEEKNARLTKMPQPSRSPFFKNGDQFKLGRITDIQGNKIDLKNNLGKITVINFWFINCSP